MQGTALELSQDLGIPYREIDYLAAGINHMAFYLRFERDGEDLYPRLRALAESGRFPTTTGCATSCCKHFGYFVTESSEHFAEYVPWFIKRDRPDLDRAVQRPARRVSALVRRADRGLGGRARVSSNAATRSTCSRSFEYAPTIIRSIETGKPRASTATSPTTASSTTCPRCTVEVPCLVDGNGVQPTHVGALPPQLAALIRTNVNVQELDRRGGAHRPREHVYHAAMLDPHTAAELDLDQIHALVDELIDAHGAWIPELS